MKMYENKGRQQARGPNEYTYRRFPSNDADIN